MKFQVAIIGTSGSGKSTVGEMLNEMVGGGYFDTVDLLKEGVALQLLRAGKIPEIGDRGATCDPEDMFGLKTGNKTALEMALAEVQRYKTDRPEYRKMLLDYGIEQEKDDPCFTVTGPLQRACFVAGNRTSAQIQEMWKRCDWILWVDREECPANETDQLTPADAHYVIDNNGTFEDLRDNLRAFLHLAGPGTPGLRYRRQFVERIDVRAPAADVHPAQD